jgi:hypothetical protein
MRCDESPQGAQVAAAHPSSHYVVLSPWVNERFPPWQHLLTAHDVARLTRRPPWVLTTLVLIGRFPRKCRYHGRGIGWLRSDVLGWLAENSAHRCTEAMTGIGRPSARQVPLASDRASSPCVARRVRGRCSSRAQVLP